MNNFDLLEQLIQEQEQKPPIPQPTQEQLQLQHCNHKNTVIDNCQTICIDCGELLSNNLTTTSEFNDYSRSSYRYSYQKNLYKDLNNLQIPEKVQEIANRLFISVIDNKVIRSTNRKSIIAACVFIAYKQLDNIQSPEYVISLFHIKMKNLLKGITIVKLNTSKTLLNDNFTTVIELIKPICVDFELNINKQDISNISSIYNELRNRHVIFTTSKAHTIVCGLLYYYCKTYHNTNISKQLDISQSTLNTFDQIIIQIR